MKVQLLDYNFINKSEKGKGSLEGMEYNQGCKKWYEGTSANNGIMLKSTLKMYHQPQVPAFMLGITPNPEQHHRHIR